MRKFGCRDVEYLDLQCPEVRQAVPSWMVDADLCGKMTCGLQPAADLPNSVAKYLDVLCISGAVELKVIGSAKIYTLTKRVPISSILSLSSEYLFVLDEEFVLTYVNENVLNFEKKTSEDVVGKTIESADFLLLSDPEIESILTECTQGKDILKEIEVKNDGKNWYFRAKFVPSILENGKRGILIILDDITEIKQYQRDLEKTVKDRTKELTQTSTTLKKEIKSHHDSRQR